MPYMYEIYKDKAGEYRARVKYNSEAIWSSKSFATKAGAQSAIESFRRNAPSAPIEDPTDLIDQLRNAPIPAADRIVRIDHNSKEFKDFQDAYRSLDKKIRTGNDLGEFGVEDIAVARNEISQIGSMVEQEYFRPAQLWEFAKRTMLWIADKAAGAVIGTFAVALLAALAALIGIPVR